MKKCIHVSMHSDDDMRIIEIIMEIIIIFYSLKVVARININILVVVIMVISTR
jgi:hypothetical protein